MVTLIGQDLTNVRSFSLDSIYFDWTVSYEWTIIFIGQVLIYGHFDWTGSNACSF